MRIYLDTCCYIRPLDDLSQLRVALEAEAILGIFKLCDEGRLQLVASEALLFEVKRDPNPNRREFIGKMLALNSQFVRFEEGIVKRVHEFESAGIDTIDAYHLAAAEIGNANIFCSCDDRLIRKARKRKDLAVKVMLPLECAQEVLS